VLSHKRELREYLRPSPRLQRAVRLRGVSSGSAVRSPQGLRAREYLLSLLVISGRLLLLSACLAAGSSSCRESPPGGTAATATVSTTIPQTVPASPAPLSDLIGPSAPLLVALGGHYLCDQRIYSRPPGPHISAWEWAFDDDPGVLTEKLAQRLPGVERETSTFRWKGPNGAVEAVVSVEDGAKSRLDCSKVPSSTRSRVVASRR
jgi:hypothetical protein